jgi:hypothetical protein
MNEILKKLFESQVLSEETKAELTEAWDIAVQKFTEEKAAEIKTELVEQFVQERAELAEKVQAFVEERLGAEVSELHEEFAAYRDLEVEYAEKLAEEKQSIAVKLAEEIDALVDKLDAFLEERFEAELSELEEELEEAQKLSFGSKIFESFKAEFAKFAQRDEAALENKVARLEDTIASLKESVAKAEESKEEVVRESKLDKVLSQLSGVKREQMSILLSSVPTEKLEESYSLYISKVLKEDKTTEQQVVTESKKDTVVLTGDTETSKEVKETKTVNEEAVLRMKRLAGIA